MKKKNLSLISLLLLGVSGLQVQAQNSSGSSGFYSGNTMWAVLVLLFVLALIAGLLFGISRNLKQMVNEKFPEEAEPGYYQRKIKPMVSAWNPTIVVLCVVAILAVVLGSYGFMYGINEVGVQQGYAPTQPINYSHKLHAGDLQIDCKYCHSTAEKSKQASIPAASTCMNCHKYVTLRDKYEGKVSPEIQKIYDAIGWDSDNNEYISGYVQKPIEWVRIHNLPDLAYFNHSQHTKVGKVECQTCHGPVQEMEKVYQFSSLQMRWCVDCHREKGIDTEGNKYYEDLHKDLKKKGEHYISVAKNGGLDCSKCHY